MRQLLLAGLLVAAGLSATQGYLEEDLRSQSYTCVDFPISFAQIQEAVDAYQDFLALDPDIKEHIAFQVNTTKRRSDVGYFLRCSAESHFDDKEFFHFHPMIFEHDSAFIEEQPVVRHFLEAAAPLWDAAVEAVSEQLSTLDQRYPGIMAAHMDTERPEVFLRFLQYRPKGDSPELAKGHYDAGSMTLAIAESGPGLRIADASGELQPIAHRDGSAVFFLGATFQGLVGDKEFHPAWHDVVRVSGEAPEERWAVVCFFNATEEQSGSWDDNHQQR